MRVVSLLPSATEIVCALGGHLVGRSHECDYPADIASAAVTLTSSRDLGADSATINASVMSAMEQGLAIYDVDVTALRAAKPDVVITQDLCEVCALPASAVEQALENILERDVTLIRLAPRVTIGEALGRSTQARAVVGDLKNRVDAVRAQTANAASPTVLTIEWLEPTMIGGLWTPELVEIAGGRALQASAGELARTLDAQALAALDPDFCVIKPCGYDLDTSADELALIERVIPTQWRCRDHATYVVDGNAYFNRSGPRLVDSAEILAGLLHPDRFQEFRTRFSGVIRRLSADVGLTDV